MLGMLLGALGPSLITGVYRRGLDIRPEGGGHVGDGRVDPAESGDRSDRQQHVGNLVCGGARGERPGGAHSRQTPGDPIATSAPTRTNAAVLGSSSREAGRPSPSPAWPSTKPSSMIASLRKISWNLTAWLIAFPRRRGGPMRPGPGHGLTTPIVGCRR